MVIRRRAAIVGRAAIAHRAAIRGRGGTVGRRATVGRKTIADRVKGPGRAKPAGRGTTAQLAARARVAQPAPNRRKPRRSDPIASRAVPGKRSPSGPSSRAPRSPLRPVERTPPETRPAPAAARARPDSRRDRPAARSPRAPRPESPTRRPARDAERPESADARQRVATYKLLIEYEGTRYSGWQEQKNAPTVMGSLRRAIEEAGLPDRRDGRRRPHRRRSARAAAVRAPAARTALRPRRALPRAQQAPAERRARPRRDARRAPRSTPATTPSRAATSTRSRGAAPRWRSPGCGGCATRSTSSDCAPRRRSASGATTSATSPTSTPATKDSTLVEVESVEVIEEGALILVRIVASHFLWRMVRRLIGTLTQVGTGHLAADAFAKLLARRAARARRSTPGGVDGAAVRALPRAGALRWAIRRSTVRPRWCASRPSRPRSRTRPFATRRGKRARAETRCLLGVASDHDETEVVLQRLIASVRVERVQDALVDLLRRPGSATNLFSRS